MFYAEGFSREHSQIELSDELFSAISWDFVNMKRGCGVDDNFCHKTSIHISSK